MAHQQQHPSPFALEAWHAGEPDAQIEAHVGSCEGCRGYVEGLVAARERFVEGRDVEDIVRAARARADAEEGTTGGPFPRWFWLAVAGATAAVLAVVTLGTLRPDLGAPPRGGSGARAGQTVPGHAAVRLKGGWLQLAAVRLRDGAQTRHQGADRLAVRRGDRLRFELTLGAPARIAAGLLTDGGRWLPLRAPTERPLPLGSHTLEEGLRVDGRGSSAGWLIAGPVAAVARARKTRLLRGVARLRIEDEPASGSRAR